MVVSDVAGEEEQCMGLNESLWIDTHGSFRDMTIVLSSLLSLLRLDDIEAERVFGVQFQPGKQLHKIVSVIKVAEYTDIPAVEREMMFVKVQAEGAMRGEILRTVDIFRCKVIDVSPTEMTIEATGDHEKLEAIIGLLHRFGIKEIARTGSVVMRRSSRAE